MFQCCFNAITHFVTAQQVHGQISLETASACPTCLAWAAKGLTATREPLRGALLRDTLRLLLSRDALEIAWTAILSVGECML